MWCHIYQPPPRSSNIVTQCMKSLSLVRHIIYGRPCVELSFFLRVQSIRVLAGQLCLVKLNWISFNNCNNMMGYAITTRVLKDIGWHVTRVTPLRLRTYDSLFVFVYVLLISLRYTIISFMLYHVTELILYRLTNYDHIIMHLYNAIRKKVHYTKPHEVDRALPFMTNLGLLRLKRHEPLLVYVVFANERTWLRPKF